MSLRKTIPVVALLLVMLLAVSPFAVADESKEQTPSNWYDGFIFQDDCFVFEFIRVLGAAHGGGSDLGECIQTALRIKDGNDMSWFLEWSRTANRINDLAKKFEKEGHVVSARSAYFRACNYYRSAGFYMHAPEHRAKSIITWSNSVECFKRGIASLPYIEIVKIPYEDTTLPGYFISAAPAGEKRPLLIVQTGFDGTGEELYFHLGEAARNRGYHCLIFEGPGQGAVLRKQDLPFRPDWEKVVTPVVDYAVNRKDVDVDRIALMGISMGGYMAPRAVAFEHRIKACIANGGIYDFSESMYKAMPPEAINSIKEDPKDFNKEIGEVMKESTQIRWFFNNGMWAFGVNSPAKLMLAIEKYNLKDCVKKIKCNMLVIDSKADIFFKDQPKKLYDELECPKIYLVFSRKETAQAHCQMGAITLSNEMVFNWLDDVMGKN
ncbi:MAG: prolyl oligopeptidase family serine peptidase [Candidatus Eremiobacteraeota bacterium]|nr:prolyl oligopeptidase family serine peptidase [Candidatus Eremiobacteraeota bacterium]